MSATLHPGKLCSRMDSWVPYSHTFFVGSSRMEWFMSTDEFSIHSHCLVYCLQTIVNLINSTFILYHKMNQCNPGKVSCHISRSIQNPLIQIQA